MVSAHRVDTFFSWRSTLPRGSAVKKLVAVSLLVAAAFLLVPAAPSLALGHGGHGGGGVHAPHGHSATGGGPSRAPSTMFASPHFVSPHSGMRAPFRVPHRFARRPFFGEGL
jgi:hypothetical protein